MSNSFFLPAASISHTSTLNAERGQLSIAAARSAADTVDNLGHQSGALTLPEWVFCVARADLPVRSCACYAGESAAGQVRGSDPVAIEEARNEPFSICSAGCTGRVR